MKDTATKRGLFAGWMLYVGGFVVLCAYGLFELFTAPDEPLLIKLCVASIGVGITLLFLTVLRQRMNERKSDPYKDVE